MTFLRFLYTIPFFFLRFVTDVLYLERLGLSTFQMFALIPFASAIYLEG